MADPATMLKAAPIALVALGSGIVIACGYFSRENGESKNTLVLGGVVLLIMSLLLQIQIGLTLTGLFFISTVPFLLGILAMLIVRLFREGY
ncbi:hypothetical protein KKH15_02735 [Patescibacteria group bacterium]|nr:hypothetical protein [Patescibacteria group bacterium]MBU1755097.1 hypothetical protein [Patescibacteria group bacterium]